MKNLQELIIQEKKNQESLKNLVSEIVSKIKKVKVPGIKRIPNCAVSAFTVSLGSLDRLNLSAEYYDSEAQAKIVNAALIECQTVTSFVDRITKIIEDRNVIIKKNRFALNPFTIAILKEAIS